jgi:V8-like Glu-specific endopeptidase
MKLILGIKHRPLWPSYERPLTDNERDAINRELSEYRDLMKSNGYDEYFNQIEYKSDDFYNILQLSGKKYRLSFEIYFKFSKKELDQFKAFVFEPTSTIAMKNDITYWSKYRNLNEKEKYVNPDAKYPVKFNVKCGVRGTVKWRPSKFIVVSQASICVPSDIRDKIVQSDLTGYHFEQVVNLTKNTTEEAYCLTANKLMPDRIIDKLHTEVDQELRREGYIVYRQGALDNINDFNFTAEATSKDDGGGDMIVSQKMRQFYLKNKLKGIYFEPVFELGTSSFEEYNKIIMDLVMVLQRYNKNHVIGHEKIDPANLVNGVL